MNSRVDWRPLAAVLVFVVVLAGCAAQGGANTTPVATPAATSGQTSSAATPAQGAGAAPAQEATAAATSTAAPAPTAIAPTAAATSAAGATPGAVPTVAASPSAAASPTAQAGATAAPTGAPTGAPALAALQLDVKPLVSGLSDPLYVTNAGDGSGRLFVVEKTGRIRIVQGGKLLDAPFLDIADRLTSAGSEQGLLGLAFPPDYATRKFFFVNYTNKKGDTVISRFTVTGDANTADPGSESVVLTFDQPAANHNGGDLVFGPDGYLWIGTGDGGGGGDTYHNGQNPDTFLAKMLRIDVLTDPSKPYTVPQDNPALAKGWKVRAEAWAIGLRNPWRYSFDRATGDLWIGDVGQNRIEEIDVVRAGSKSGPGPEGGLNFGWPIMEGPSCFQQQNCDKTGLTLPVASYQHGADGCSVTGGFVYRGQQFAALQGVYLYGDYCSGRIWGLDAANPGPPKLLLETGPGLSSFGQDEAGELYITDLSKGTVRQIVVK